MCQELNDELARGSKLAQQLVDHVLEMGAGAGEIPVTVVGENGDLQIWKVSVRRESTMHT